MLHAIFGVSSTHLIHKYRMTFEQKGIDSLSRWFPVLEERFRISLPLSSLQRKYWNKVFTGRFPTDYPNQTIQSIQLNILEGHLPEEIVDSLATILNKEVCFYFTLISQAKKLEGEAVVFALVERLKEELTYINEIVLHGEFGLVSGDIIIEIFRFLSIYDLGRIASVSKRFHKLSESNIVSENRF